MKASITRDFGEDSKLDEVPHHYLKRTTSSRRPRRIVCLDTEAARRQTADGETQTFGLAVASYDKMRSDQGHKPSTTWATFTDGPGELWKWITDLAPKRDTVWVFAHNLQYDALISDVMGQLPALGWEMSQLDAPGRLRSMRWYKDGRRLFLVDTFEMFRMPLDKLAGLVGHEKLTMPGPGQRQGKWLTYCRRDVEVLRTAVLGVLDFLDDEKLGSWQSTLPALAWSAYRHRFMTVRPLVHRHADVLALERDAYFGGRSEVLNHEEHTDGLWEDWDIRMCYPHVAATQPLPFHYVGRVDEPSAEEYQRARSTLAVLGEVTVTVDRPLVPCRTDLGVSWPVGTFRTTLWDPEIDLLLKAGATIEWHQLHVYRRGHVLRDFAQWTIDSLHGDDNDIDPLRAYLIKGMSRMVVGKLGQRSRQLVPSEVVPERQWGEWTQYDADTGQRHNLVAIDGRTFEIDTSGEVDNALPSMAGYITSAARVMLYDLITTVGRDNVIYCDTDGLILSADGVDRLHEAMARGQLPPLLLKGVYRRVKAWGPQDLELDGGRVIKGLPGNAERIGPDSFRVRRFTSWSQAVDAGVLDRVIVTERTVRFQRIYKRGWLLEDGRVWPLVIRRENGANRVLPWTSTPWCHLGHTLVDPRQADHLGRDPP